MKRIGVWLVVIVAACDGTFRFDEPVATTTDRDGGLSTSDASVEAGVACTSDPVCGGLRCDLGTGRCVACIGDSDCASPLARCETSSHVCVACLNGPDCGKRQSCDTITNRCLDACFDADDCLSAGFVCDRDRALCIQCKSDANCSAASGGPLCNTQIGRCVECVGDPDCASPKAICDRRAGKCVACVSSDSCATAEACDPSTLTCRSATAP